MSLEQERTEGMAAAALKNDPAFARSILNARQQLIDQWTKAATTEEREALWFEWHALGRVLGQLDVVEGRGHLAQAALKQHAKSAKHTSA